MIKAWTGSWHMVFVITAAMNFLVVALALFVLRPMRSRQLVAPVPEFAAAPRPT
jgi:OFA family oxalate/formate antiporter-like MFS transporter